MVSDPTAIPMNVDPERMRMQGVTRMGNKAFDVPYISHIEGNLWQGGCATGLRLPTNIEHLISLYPWEQYDVRHQLKSASFHWLYDAEDEPPAIVRSIAAWVAECVKDGPTLVHCQAGLNRSSLIAGLTLMLGGRAATDAIALLREKRSDACLANPTFEAWLRGVKSGN